MSNKRILDFKLEVAKLEQVITDLKDNVQKEIDKKREINTKKISLIRQGNKKAEVIELNKELLEINANILFLNEEIEIMSEHIAEVKQEKVMELIEYRQQRYDEMKKERSEMEKELYRLKAEYLLKVKEIAGHGLWDMKRELWELNDVIRNYGDGNKLKQPRLLMGLDIQEFSAPRPVDGVSPLPMVHELQEAIKG